MPVLSQVHQILSVTIINSSNETWTSQHENIPEQSRALLWTIVITLCLTLIVLLTICGNILVLIALCINYALRSPTHLLMGNLACADLLLGITVLPFSGTLEVLHGQWLFGRIFCHIWLTIDVLYCTASIYGLMFISIERYIGVTRPLRYPIIVTHRRTVYAIFLAWIVSALISLAPFLSWHKEIKSIDRTCEVNDDLYYVLFSCSFSFYIPLIIILCVYGRIYGEANRQYQFLTGGQKKVQLTKMIGEETVVTLRVHLPKHMSTPPSANGHEIRSVANGDKITSKLASAGSNKFTRLKRERKAAKTLGIVVGMFILCWLPFFLLLPIKAFTATDPGVLFSICFWLGYCNSCFNPFIYAFSSREFRRTFKSILKCQRIKQYKPSGALSRVSSATEHRHAGQSNSCDMSGTRLLNKSESLTSNQTSNDSQHHQLMSSKYNRNIEKKCRPLPTECVVNTLISESTSTPDNTSPWHRRTSFIVR